MKTKLVKILYKKMHFNIPQFANAGPNFKEEIVLHAEIDLNDVIRSKIDFDPVGHYSRPDVFSLVVNQKENPPVSFINGPKEDEVDEKEFKKLQVSDA